ncbi:MAG: hypothetical protein RBR97_07090 [Bacteroidales bacterium]|nr:hypothetical protein [Bacteroidales bacterium]
MNLFEIVGSYIPDEQKANIKAKIDGEIVNITKGNEAKLKKDLSEKYGVNLFEEDVEKAFSETAYIRKDNVKNLYTELETYKTQLEEKEKTLKTLTEESLINKVTIRLVKEGFKEERLNLVKPLLKDAKENETIEEKVLRVKQEVPELFQGSKDANLYHNGGSDSKKTGMEEYFEKRREEMSKIKK